MIDIEEFENLLDMSRFSFENEQEYKEFYEEINAEIKNLEEIKKIDTSRVITKEFYTDKENCLRDDVVEEGLSLAELRKFTTNFLDGYYTVPKTIIKSE